MVRIVVVDLFEAREREKCQQNATPKNPGETIPGESDAIVLPRVYRDRVARIQGGERGVSDAVMLVHSGSGFGEEWESASGRTGFFTKTCASEWERLAPPKALIGGALAGVTKMRLADWTAEQFFCNLF